MPTPNIIMINGFLLVRQIGNTSGITADDSLSLYGVVELINTTTTDLIVGDNVFFDPIGVEKIIESGQSYFLVKQRRVITR